MRKKTTIIVIPAISFMLRDPTPTKGGTYKRRGTRIIAPPKPNIPERKPPERPINNRVISKPRISMSTTF